MFWLNSRGSLVTATSRSRGWHPLYRRYGANLPNSLAWIFADTPWASHPGAPVSVLGTVARIDPNALFTGTTDERKALRPYSRVHPLLAITALRGLRRLIARLDDSACRDASDVGQGSARCRNINLLPFRVLRLGEHLGPTNPRLTSIAEEPWPLRRCGFSPHFAATPPRILIRTRSTGPHGPTSTRARRPPTRSPFGALQYR